MISRSIHRAGRAGKVAGAGLLLALVFALSACGDDEPKRSGEFKLNPGDFYCTGYKEGSVGDTNLLPGDHYWEGTLGQDCDS